MEEREEKLNVKKKKKYRTHLSPTCTVFNSTTLTFGEGGLDERPFSPPFSQIIFYFAEYMQRNFGGEVILFFPFSLQLPSNSEPALSCIHT